MMEDQLPDRVRAAEERREFDRLLDVSSVGPVHRNQNRAMVHCGPCADDQCGEIGCTGVDCSCVCLAEKEILAGHVKDVMTRLGCWFSADDTVEIAESLYRKGWRRE